MENNRNKMINKQSNEETLNKVNNRKSEKLTLMNIQTNDSVKNKHVAKMMFDEYHLEEF